MTSLIQSHPAIKSFFEAHEQEIDNFDCLTSKFVHDNSHLSWLSAVRSLTHSPALGLPSPTLTTAEELSIMTRPGSQTSPLSASYGLPSVLLSSSSQRNPSNVEDFIIGTGTPAEERSTHNGSQHMTQSISSSSSLQTAEEDAIAHLPTSRSFDMSTMSFEAPHSSALASAVDYTSARRDLSPTFALNQQAMHAARHSSGDSTTSDSSYNAFRLPFESTPSFLSIPQHQQHQQQHQQQQHQHYSSPSLTLTGNAWQQPYTSLSQLTSTPSPNACSNLVFDAMHTLHSPDGAYRSSFPASSTPATASSAAAKRVPAACNFCRVRKLRCDGQIPCRQCARRSISCVYSEAAESRKRRRRAVTVSEVPGPVSSSSSLLSYDTAARHNASPNLSIASSGSQSMLNVPSAGPVRPSRPHSQSFISYSTAGGAPLSHSPASGQTLSAWTLAELGMNLTSGGPAAATFPATSPFLEPQMYFGGADSQQQHNPHQPHRTHPSA